ncbi:Similar to DHFR: Dihydrofolate reductase (Aedes albopictus) [Cotesia congregata]|uniref:dihydrofolate reductase n=1 Tax=Cotesia congregata TaxID=51543 RepID=A0A8J2HEJ1_COTCN|nr:Similar to DHFR: Dihydrofolate reductase (Aedes albopictus) [Cotesia congregata]
MQLKLNLIAAACGDNLGIGINGRLPWKLKAEMAFFTNMTTKTENVNKKNVVIMGRKTWEGIPKKFRPLQNRINIILSHQKMQVVIMVLIPVDIWPLIYFIQQINKSDYENEPIVCQSLQHALDTISKTDLCEIVENIWVIGGHAVYKAAMDHPNCFRIYLTYIKKDFECDTFFPSIPNNFIETSDTNIPSDIQEENGIQFLYKVYEKVSN